MSLLVDLGIAKSESESTKVFEQLLGNDTFQTISYSSPKEYIAKYWEAFQKVGKPTLNGNVFEFIIYTLLYREGIIPFYTQAKVAFVPNIIFDTMLYAKASPVSLSLKTSLRERYKQADLEAIALKYVHRKAKCYLLTLDAHEANSVKRKIVDGDVIGLDAVIDCNTDDIDDLIQQLHSIKEQFTVSTKIEIVTGNLVQ